MSEHFYAMSDRPKSSMENHLYILLSRIEDKLTALAHSTSELVSIQHTTATALNRLVSLQEPKPPSPAPIPNAGTRLTQTYELLQDFLLMLPMEDVLLAQRVNKTFLSTIANSLLLQQKLFLAPVPAQPERPPINPLLLKPSVLLRLPLFYCHQTKELKFFDGHERAHLEVRGPVVTWEDSEGWSLQWRMTPGPHLEQAVLSPGSWEKMLVVQPGCRIECWICGKLQMLGRMELGAGLRMGEIIQALVKGPLEPVTPW
ncbi:hypothetical protein LTR56_009021 [Elasticomyces elasticus]|nr:hypothetical protein LTR56_009021 [Elasticomyces elasticus]KAK3663822.1 hypothetical protein LTR22_005283 [Elasticomyces elasticus]KAK4923970.1 hypothetical protein LTR49_008915 [Elasticomyces elasticus]KAK5762154.1 hypothetical protein LTS12_007675 [Elasticomyces elasticus]